MQPVTKLIQCRIFLLRGYQSLELNKNSSSNSSNNLPHLNKRSRPSSKCLGCLSAFTPRRNRTGPPSPPCAALDPCRCLPAAPIPKVLPHDDLHLPLSLIGHHRRFADTSTVLLGSSAKAYCVFGCICGACRVYDPPRPQTHKPSTPAPPTHPRLVTLPSPFFPPPKRAILAPLKLAHDPDQPTRIHYRANLSWGGGCCTMQLFGKLRRVLCKYRFFFSSRSVDLHTEFLSKMK